MKTFITILVIILSIFILLFIAKGIFGFELKFEKAKEEIMQETNPSTGSTDSQQAEEIIQDITELSAQILKEGTGNRQVKAGDEITVHYTGMLLDGTKFDSSVDRGQPFSLTIGAGQGIQGWDAGIIGMKIGEQRRLFIPSELAYGEQGAGDIIGPNADLVFDVELISIDNQEKNVEDTVDEEIKE